MPTVGTCSDCSLDMSLKDPTLDCDFQSLVDGSLKMGSSGPEAADGFFISREDVLSNGFRTPRNLK